MQTIDIQTTQNVTIEYPIASIGDRVVAALIDLLIMVGYLIIIVFLYIWLSSLTEGTALHYPVASFIILFLPFFFYHLLCETFLNGQSFGKKIMKMRVVKIDGAQATFGSYFLRWILAPIDFFFYGSVGLVTMLINGKGQRLGDLAAHTTVIKLKTQTKLEDTILASTPVDYEVKFYEVKQLNDKDISIVKEVFDLNYKKPDVVVYMSILNKTKQTLEQKMGVQTDLPPLNFIDTVLKDYNHLMGNE